MIDPHYQSASYALLITLVLPLAGCILLFFSAFRRTAPNRPPARWPGLFATCLVLASLVFSIAAVTLTHHGTLMARAGEWIPGFGPSWSLQLDWLSSWLLLLVETIGLMVHVFSLGYMSEERSQSRYFAGLLFFVAMMKLLILSGSYLLLFAGWEGVGLASYLLIAYHFERPRAAQAATKAFIVNRIGDGGLLLGIIALALTCSSTTYADVALAAVHLPHFTLTLICILLVIGAIGKSAQFPLHVWLPDAMEGPTPVSALIHSATMVCAGVYLLARSSFLLNLAPEVGEGVAVLGAVTALFAASVALAENDIKRVLAYSTISQLGFMFIALGLRADRPAMFHVVTHAFFKSLLFLGAGAVIHALHGEQNLKHMGGLRRGLPVTFWTMCIASLTLAGLPGLSAFFSKDLILESSLASGHTILTVLGTITSFFTACYSWRLMSLAFFGESRRHHLTPHQPPRTMHAPMIVLAACCILVGWIFVPIHWAAWPLMLSSTVVALLGLSLAWYFYVSHPERRAALDLRFAPVTDLLRSRWYIDALYEQHVLNGLVLRTAYGAALLDRSLVNRTIDGLVRLSRRTSRLFNWTDSRILDGIVRVISTSTRFLSWPSRALQTGFVQTYALLFIVGAIAVLGYYLVR
jgi:NADH-quinone oxidoreductase subunit L